jgi:hypothetical protein
MEARGVNGQVSFDGSTVTITRDGVLGRMTQGRGSKTIPVSAIGAVQFRPPTLTVNGTWSLSISGEVQSSTSARGRKAVSKVARDDENAVVVRHGQVKAFEALTAAINAARAGGGIVQPAPVAAPVDQGREALIAQLRQLGSMHHSGSIDDATFIREMHGLLPRL